MTIKTIQYFKYFKKIGKTKSISSWKSKGLSDEVVKSPSKGLAPTLGYTGRRMYVEFNGSCLIKQDKFTFDNRKIVNIYIAYDLQ